MDGAIDFKPFELLPLEYNILEKVIKLVLNSVYGKLAQYVGSEGKGAQMRQSILRRCYHSLLSAAVNGGYANLACIHRVCRDRWHSLDYRTSHIA